MCERATLDKLNAVGSGLSVVGAGVGAVGAIQKGRVDAQVAENNATIARFQAKDAKQRGSEEASAITAAGARETGALVAQGGASGVDITSGSGANVFSVAEMAAASDAARVRANASREAWAYRTGAETEEARARAARPASLLGASSMVLSGFGSAISAYSKGRK